MALTLLAIIIAALLALAVSAILYGLRAARSIMPAVALLSCFGAIVVLSALIAGEARSVLILPLGPPVGGPMRLVFDSLAGGFLLLLFIVGVACGVFASLPQDPPRRSLVGTPAALAAIALILLAGDPFTLVVGVGLQAVSGWLMLRPSRATSGRDLGAAMLGAICLIAALAIAAPSPHTWLAPGPAPIIATGLEGWRAIAMFVLACASAAALLPSASWRSNRHTGSPGSATALMAGAGALPAVYVLIRLTFDASGPATPLWWGMALLMLGAGLSVVGAARATLAAGLDTAVMAGTPQQIGLATAALGVGLLARATDLPTLATLALDAAWLQIVAHVLCRTLLLLCAGAVRTEAATIELERLGGLIHRMPVTAACALAGLLGLTALPVGLGFAGFWLLFQALLGAARIGGFAIQILVTAVVGLVALSAGIGALATLRLFGVAFLGRPRTPRAAVANEVPLMQRVSLIGLAVLVAVLGLLPALAVLPVRAGFAVLANSAPAHDGLPSLLTTGAEMPGYVPLAIGALLAVAGGATLWSLRRYGTTGERIEAAWSGGFAAPPAWLPFGDPATQYGAASLAEPIRQALHRLPTGLCTPGVRRLASPMRLGRRQRYAIEPARAVIALLGVFILIFAVCMAVP